jgi:hypothetical protein
MSEHEQAIRNAADRYRETETVHEKARAKLIAVVVEALKDGERPTDVTSWSPFTPAYIRRLAREHGIAGRPPGARRTAEPSAPSVR